MLERVDFMSESDAARLAGKYDHGFVSMTDADKETRLHADAWGAFIHLAVDDITLEREGWTRFEAPHARQLLSWLAENEPTLRVIHVHCAQGISRSAAVARFVASRYGVAYNLWDGRGYNKHIFETLMAEDRGYGANLRSADKCPKCLAPLINRSGAVAPCPFGHGSRFVSPLVRPGGLTQSVATWIAVEDNK